MHRWKSPDLHMHSTFSDGVLTPMQLAEAAARAGVDVMAITDHDSFEGSDRLLGTELPVRFITGVELSISDMEGLHLLAYGLTEGRELRRRVRELAQHRVERAQQMVALLDGMGIHLDWSELMEKTHGSVGRPHIASQMVEKGFVADKREAFARYLDNGKPAYVAGERLNMTDALTLVRRSGFVPVLAHPYELNKPAEQLVSLVEHWQRMGLMGMEVYHPSTAGKGTEQLDRMARRMGLLVTGGSDYHQDQDKHGAIGCMVPAWSRAEDDVQALLDAMAREKERVENEPAQ